MAKTINALQQKPSVLIDGDEFEIESVAQSYKMNSSGVRDYVDDLTSRAPLAEASIDGVVDLIAVFDFDAGTLKTVPAENFQNSEVAAGGGGILADLTADNAGTTTGANVTIVGGTGIDTAVVADALTINASGTLGLQTIFIPAGAMRPTFSAGCASITDLATTADRPDIQHLAFDSVVNEHAQFQIAMPKKWNLGTLTYQVFWTGLVADAGNVAWGLQAVAVSNGETIDAAYGTSVVQTDAYIFANFTHVSPVSGVLTVAGIPADDDMVYFRIIRDAANVLDTRNVEDANLIGIKLFFTTDAETDV